MTLSLPTILANCSSPSSAARPPALFVIPGIQGAPYYHLLIEGAQREATKQGATVQVDAPVRWDGNLQTNVVHAVAAKQVDAIIIAPCDNQMLIGPLKRAYDKGIQIVTVDTVLGTGDYTHGAVTFPLVSIGSDNVKGGHLLGEALIKTIGGRGAVYLQNNTPDASTAIERAQSFKDDIAATKGAVTLVAEEFDEGDISKATAQTLAILQAHPDLTAIFAADVYSAQGVVAAVEEERGRLRSDSTHILAVVHVLNQGNMSVKPFATRSTSWPP